MPLTVEREPETTGVDDESAKRHVAPRTARRRPKARYLYAIIGVTSLIVWWGRPGPDTLLLKSKRLRIGNLDVLGWATDHYLLACTPFNTGNPQGRLIDVVTGEQKPLDGLNAALSNAPPGTLAWSFRNRVSPDGKWLLWGFTPSRVPIIRHQFATRMDGSRTIEWVDKTLTWGYFVMWLNDSERWIRIRTTRNRKRGDEFQDVEEYSLRSPGVLKRYPVPFTAFSIMGWAAPGRIVSSPGNQWRSATQRDYDVIDYTAVPPRLDRKSIALPESCQMTDTRLTPDGKRMILMTSRSETNMWLEMTRFIRTLSGWDAWITMWAADPDGSRYKEIGRFRSNLWGNGSTYALVGPSPNGKKVAFLFGNSCYVAPVP